MSLLHLVTWPKFENSSNSVIAERCQWALSAVRRLVVRLPVPLWPHLKDGFCARLAIHTVCHCSVTPHQNKQQTTHSAFKKKDEEVVQRRPLKSNFLILVTPSASLTTGPPFQTMCLYLCCRMQTQVLTSGGPLP